MQTYDFLKFANRRILLGFCTALLWAPAFAAPPEFITYTVNEGDTLESIGQRFLAKPENWREIQKINKVPGITTMPVGMRLTIPARLLRQINLSAKITSAIGMVVADGRILDEKDIGGTLDAGSRVQTGPSGKLTVRMPDGSRLRVGPNSNLVLSTLHSYPESPSQAVDVTLTKGRVESEVESQKGTAARYRITTPTGVIGVRGTEFRVATTEDAQSSQAEVIKGRVNVANRTRARDISAGFGVQLAAAKGKELGDTVALPAQPDLVALPKEIGNLIARFALPKLSHGEHYRAIVSHAANPDAVEFEGLLDEPILRVPNLQDGDYVLRVRTIASNGMEGLDAEHSFKIKAHPEAPFLMGPTPNAKAAEGDIRFAWANVPEAATYRFQASNSEDFSKLLLDQDALTETEFKLALEAGSVYWRVASKRANGDQGPWSPVSLLQVRPLPSLTGEPETKEGQLQLRWMGDPEVKYEYAFARDAMFKDILSEGKLEKPEVSLPIPEPDKYYLRIRSIEPDGFISPWTQPQKIFVPADFPWLLFAIPFLAL